MWQEFLFSTLELHMSFSLYKSPNRMSFTGQSHSTLLSAEVKWSVPLIKDTPIMRKSLGKTSCPQCHSSISRSLQTFRSQTARFHGPKQKKKTTDCFSPSWIQIIHSNYEWLQTTVLAGLRTVSQTPTKKQRFYRVECIQNVRCSLFL